MERVRSLDGTLIAYDRIGRGPALIIVGGGPTTRMAYAELASRLSQDFTVLNYDRRGRGDSGDTLPFTVDREYEDLAAVLRTVGEKVTLVGSSGGAVLALEAAVRGFAVQRLALWEPSYVIGDRRPPVPDDYRDRLQEMVESGRRGDAVAYFFTAAAGLPEEFVTPMRQAPFWGSMEQIAHALVYDAAVVGDFQPPVDRLATISVPTLVLDGATTPYLTEAADAVADAVPFARRQTLSGQPHNVDASALAAAVAEFVKKES